MADILVPLAFAHSGSQTHRVETSEGSNLIGGCWEPALEGGMFETRARSAPFEVTRRWPRSGAADALRALRVAGEAGAGWVALGRAGRVRQLARLPERLEALGLENDLARGLGLEPGELPPWLAQDPVRLRESLEMHLEGADGAGAGVFQAHWSDVPGELVAQLAARLAAGHTAVIVSSPRLPLAALAVAQAVRAAELPAGVVSVLHDDTGEALRGALGDPGVSWARLRAMDGELARLAERLGGLAPGWNVQPVRGAVHGIEEQDDPLREAALVAEKAVGRSSTLSGQMPGQVGRIVCHQRLFSRFCEEFLACLETAPDVQRPVAVIDGDLPEHVRGAWALGLDEGATPIFGGEPLLRSAAPPDSIGSKGGRPPRAIPPVVFTNVEPGLRLAGLGRPAPVLALIRGTSNQGVRELVAELESRDPIRTPLTNEARQA